MKSSDNASRLSNICNDYSELCLPLTIAIAAGSGDHQHGRSGKGGAGSSTATGAASTASNAHSHSPALNSQGNLGQGANARGAALARSSARFKLEGVLIPDTVIYQGGKPVSWFFSSTKPENEGLLQTR